MNESETTGAGPAPDVAPAPAPAPASFPAPGAASFPEPSFAPPGWPPSADTGLDSRPHILQGPYWVAFDRQHWWNGSTWIPGPPPTLGSRTFGPGASAGMGVLATIVGLIAFGLIAVFAFGICTSMQQPGFPGAPMP